MVVGLRARDECRHVAGSRTWMESTRPVERNNITKCTLLSKKQWPSDKIQNQPLPQPRTRMDANGTYCDDTHMMIQVSFRVVLQNVPTK